jgi:hypothetical protein
MLWNYVGDVTGSKVGQVTSILVYISVIYLSLSGQILG